MKANKTAFTRFIAFRSQRTNSTVPARGGRCFDYGDPHANPDLEAAKMLGLPVEEEWSAASTSRPSPACGCPRAPGPARQGGHEPGHRRRRDGVGRKQAE